MIPHQVNGKEYILILNKLKGKVLKQELDSFGFIEVIQSLKSDNEKLLERVKVLEEREESFSNRIGSSDHFRYLELRLSKLEELVKDYPFGSQNVSTASDPIS